MQEELNKSLLISRVILHKNEINILTHKFINVLLKQINDHDNSKLREPELSMFSRNIQDFKNDHEYLSTGYNELIQQIDDAIQHHYSENRHHPEHFDNGINDMNLIDISDMLFDWMASNPLYQNNLEETEKMIHKQKERFNLSDQLVDILINTARVIIETT